MDSVLNQSSQPFLCTLSELFFLLFFRSLTQRRWKFVCFVAITRWRALALVSSFLRVMTAEMGEGTQAVKCHTPRCLMCPAQSPSHGEKKTKKHTQLSPTSPYGASSPLTLRRGEAHDLCSKQCQRPQEQAPDAYFTSKQYTHTHTHRHTQTHAHTHTDTHIHTHLIGVIERMRGCGLKREKCRGFSWVLPRPL